MIAGFLNVGILTSLVAAKEEQNYFVSSDGVVEAIPRPYINA